LKPVLPGDKYYLEPIYEEPHFVADYLYDDKYDDDVYDDDIYSFYDKDAISKIDKFAAYIVRVGSTTIITAVITYAMLFLF